MKVRLLIKLLLNKLDFINLKFIPSTTQTHNIHPLDIKDDYGILEAIFTLMALWGTVYNNTVPFVLAVEPVHVLLQLLRSSKLILNKSSRWAN